MAEDFESLISNGVFSELDDQDEDHFQNPLAMILATLT